MQITLPWPPSVNNYWNHTRTGQTYVSKRGKDYRKAVVILLLEAGVTALDGPLYIKIRAYPPDRRKRDIDNILKALLDALQHGGAYHDDAQIVHLDVWKLDPVKGGRVDVMM